VVRVRGLVAGRQGEYVIFSVFDPNARRFDYYEAPGHAANYGARGTKYRALTQPPQGGLAGPSGRAGPGGGGGAQAVGFAPEALAMRLPHSAMLVGHGDEARGIIAEAWGHSGGGFSGAVDGYMGGYGVDLGLAGLGEGEAPPPPPVVAASGVSFGQVIVAACVASIVGVIVQRAFIKKKR